MHLDIYTKHDRTMKIASVAGFHDCLLGYHNVIDEFIPHWNGQPFGFYTQTGSFVKLLNYFGNLHAINEAEQFLDIDERKAFVEALKSIYRLKGTPEIYAYSALAEERADAFGKAKKLW